MPLVKAAAAQPETAPAEAPPRPAAREVLLEQLASHDADERRRAARALAGDPDAAPALAACLADEQAAPVRDALFASLVETGGTLAAALLAPLLRSDDAALRNAAQDALKRLGADAAEALDPMIADPDPDVRILAIEVTRAWPPALAAPRLLRIIADDRHVNVCGAAVDVATEVGTSDLIPALTALRARFPGEPFLLFASELACARIDPTRATGGAAA